MAKFHLTTKHISRSSGRSSTAAAAYRAAVAIYDERTGLTHDYSKRDGVIMSVAFMLNDDNQPVYLDPQTLWNKAEAAEKRKDGRTAREWIVAIPHELIPTDEADQKNIKKNQGARAATKFAKLLAERYGVAVDIAIHAPDAEGDERNYHAHIMTTTRQVEIVGDDFNLTDKTTLELSNAKRSTLGLERAKEDIKELRAEWANIANGALEANGIDERIDHRSHADRGIDAQPTIKLGWKSSELERSGIETDRGDINRAIKADNQQLKDLELEIIIEQRRPRPTPIPSIYYDTAYQTKITKEHDDELEQLPALMFQELWDHAIYNRDTDPEAKEIFKKMGKSEITQETLAEQAPQRLKDDKPELVEAYKLVQEAQEDTEQLRRAEVQQEPITTAQNEPSPVIARPKPR